MKRVAWVMVNYNGGEELFRSMDSLQSDLSHEDHIFLIDNGSVDHSIERVQQAFPEVTVLLNRENQPFARATNRGIIQAKEQGFRFIGMINPDVRIRAGMTDSLSSSLENDRMTGAVSPVITYVTEPEKIWFAGGAICWWLGWSRHQYLGKRLDRLPNHPFRSKTLTGCCILAPAKIWETVGLLDDSYAMYTEDVDWSYRVRLRGFQLLVNPGAVLLHNVSSSTGGGRTPFKMKYRTLSSRLFFHRYTPFPQRIVQIIASRLAALVYLTMLLRNHEVAAAAAFARAWMSPLEDPVPWPPKD